MSKPTETGERRALNEAQYLHMHLEKIDETTCGFWKLNCDAFQRLASKKLYILVFGMIGCLNVSMYGYYSATISTIEKRFKVPSKNFGMISTGYDISAILTSVCLTYYASKQHRPRVMALAQILVAISCSLYGLVHVVYGPGEEATTLTLEYGANFDNQTGVELLEAEKRKALCFANKTEEVCDASTEESALEPQLIFFVSNMIAALGSTLVSTLGVTYLDDNVRKEKAPILLSITNFMRMLGTPVGFGLASYCLKIYVASSMHPSIPNSDPRWIGAWWMGWFVLSAVSMVGALFFGKTLPRTAKRRLEQLSESSVQVVKPSFRDYKATALRLFKNKVLMFNNAAGVFYTFGYLPYFTFQTKYIEIIYKRTASEAALITGSVTLVFSALGLLVSGVVISKFRPSARTLAAYNVVSSLLSITGILLYAVFGCDAGNNTSIVHNSMDTTACNSKCECDYVKYSPICGGNQMTYISACHAGCTEELVFDNGTKIFQNCSCISESSIGNEQYPPLGTAVPGVCPVDCVTPLILFLVIVCLNKFIGGTEGTANFMIGMRCIDEQDKIISLSIAYVMIGLLALIPSPIVFGTIIDGACVLWGKTCTKKGNCWLYDEKQLRYMLNFSSAGFVAIGTVLDMGTWYYSKDVKLFDDEVEQVVEIKESNFVTKPTVESACPTSVSKESQ